MTTVKKMKEKTTKMSEIITMLCEKISENIDEVVHDNIRKTMESSEEKNEIKKVTEVTSRIANQCTRHQQK